MLCANSFEICLDASQLPSSMKKLVRTGGMQPLLLRRSIWVVRSVEFNPSNLNTLG